MRFRYSRISILILRPWTLDRSNPGLHQERKRSSLSTLQGNAADMDAIMDIARRHNLKVIEDCAQSYLTKYKGRLVGTIGDYGCFSTNDFQTININR